VLSAPLGLGVRAPAPSSRAAPGYLPALHAGGNGRLALDWRYHYDSPSASRHGSDSGWLSGGVTVGDPEREDRSSGCLLGGAVGDALGAPVEFVSLSEIRRRFGPNGIEQYAPAYGRVGAITDDTQMTLFTAEGLIRAMLRFQDRGICNPVAVIQHAYLRWLATQGESNPDPTFGTNHDGWLYQQRQLHSRRGPGSTCLSALRQTDCGIAGRATNDSKGCGGVMRVAPVGLIANEPFKLGCDTAAITHGHPSGYLAAGFLAHTIAEVVRGAGLLAAIGSAQKQLERQAGHEECTAAVAAALDAAASSETTPESVERLGEGWVAEEALAISLFCALKAEDFAHGVRLAVNHSGDSDSTGAITGNLLGAQWGKHAIPEEFLADLELREVIEQLATDLARPLGDDDYERYPPW